MFCVIDFFITYSDVEILLLDVKTRYTVLPLKSGRISEKRNDLCVHCGACLNFSSCSWRELSYMTEATNGYNTGKDKESCKNPVTVIQTRISKVLIGK